MNKINGSLYFDFFVHLCGIGMLYLVFIKNINDEWSMPTP
jgi:hypothetical protein